MRQDIKKSAERRLAIIGGQVEGVREMVVNEKYCVDIITQIEAAREALAGVGDLVLENHLETHVADDIKHGKGRKATAEILKVYKLSRKG
ncbi:MAG: metal-sensitive transcriptional regulator [Patescibacteria group bacterium]|nr:metal-sensitive transcriptional regulator [Patescibacteria group bacterium]